ncbi:hypothetical protein C8R44DRAFT_975962 [Mycena epipterygia]|nr:hypothetical protein C8R44DRAFT_975962 [Mycena epipterygia]
MKSEGQETESLLRYYEPFTDDAFYDGSSINRILSIDTSPIESPATTTDSGSYTDNMRAAAKFAPERIVVLVYIPQTEFAFEGDASSGGQNILKALFESSRWSILARSPLAAHSWSHPESRDRAHGYEYALNLGRDLVTHAAALLPASTTHPSPFSLRPATLDDVPTLERLVLLSSPRVPPPATSRAYLPRSSPLAPRRAPGAYVVPPANISLRRNTTPHTRPPHRSLLHRDSLSARAYLWLLSERPAAGPARQPFIPEKRDTPNALPRTVACSTATRCLLKCTPDLGRRPPSRWPSSWTLRRPDSRRSGAMGPRRRAPAPPLALRARARRPSPPWRPRSPWLARAVHVLRELRCDPVPRAVPRHPGAHAHPRAVHVLGANYAATLHIAASGGGIALRVEAGAVSERTRPRRLATIRWDLTAAHPLGRWLLAHELASESPRYDHAAWCALRRVPLSRRWLRRWVIVRSTRKDVADDTCTSTGLVTMRWDLLAAHPLRRWFLAQELAVSAVRPHRRLVVLDPIPGALPRRPCARDHRTARARGARPRVRVPRYDHTAAWSRSRPSPPWRPGAHAHPRAVQVLGVNYAATLHIVASGGGVALRVEAGAVSERTRPRRLATIRWDLTAVHPLGRWLLAHELASESPRYEHAAWCALRRVPLSRRWLRRTWPTTHMYIDRTRDDAVGPPRRAPAAPLVPRARARCLRGTTTPPPGGSRSRPSPPWRLRSPAHAARPRRVARVLHVLRELCCDAATLLIAASGWGVALRVEVGAIPSLARVLAAPAPTLTRARCTFWVQTMLRRCTLRRQAGVSPAVSVSVESSVEHKPGLSLPRDALVQLIMDTRGGGS